MNGFEQDLRERTSLSRSASRRVCGARSRRCSLPSDRLTPAQWRAKNGPVRSVRLGVPMTWGDFLKLDDELKNGYLRDLGRKGLSLDQIARMTGTDGETLGRELDRLGWKIRGERLEEADHRG